MCSVRSAELICSFQVAQFDTQNCCLDSVHSAVPTNHHVMILTDLAVISQDPDFLLQFGVISHHCAGLTECTEILPRVEAETASIAKTSHLSAFVSGSVSLAGILNEK